MAAVQVAQPVYNLVRKQIVGIRHGQALHNVVAPLYGNKIFTQFRDTALTVEGMVQAKTAQVPDVDVVLVSPLTRALQTAQLMYPDIPTIALECLKELPQDTELCNQRSSKSNLEMLFPKVNFDDLMTEEQIWPIALPPAVFCQQFDDFVERICEEKIAVVTHSTWLKYYMTGDRKAEPELHHCFPYKMTNGIR